MPTFQKSTLGQMLSFYNGKAIKPGGEGQYPVYGSNGVIGGCDEFKYSDGIIVGRVGAYCGSVQYCPGKFWASDNTIVVKPQNADFNVRFLYYLLSDLNLNNYAGGAAQPLVTQSVLKQVEALSPPIKIQRKIASILSAYDDLIENNTRRIRILEEMAQAIYREWFVNFRFPGHEKARMVDSPLGRVPEGWEVGRLQDFIELCYGKALKAEDRHDGPYPVYGSSGIVGQHSESLVQGPGIIIGRKGNVGSVHWTDKPFYPIDTVYYVKTDLSLYYAFYNLQNQNFINNDAAVPGLNRNQAYALPFLLPQKQVLQAFDEFCAAIFCQVRCLSSKNQNLRQTRDLLLPKLISGKVEVPDIVENEAV